MLSPSTSSKYHIGVALVTRQSRRQVLQSSIASSSVWNNPKNGLFAVIADSDYRRLFSSQQRRRQERQQERRQKLKLSVMPKLTSLKSTQELRQEQVKRQQQEEKDRNNKPQKPWWRYISIWPDPHGYDPEFERQHSIRWPKTKEEFNLVWEKSIKEYRSSFEGFLLPESKETESEKAAAADVPLSELVESHRKDISANVAKNVKFLKEEGSETLKAVQKQTGIYTLQHLREWAARQLQLATECVNQFMVGYREGRDDEVDKMMNLYFQQLVDEDDNEKAAEQGKKRRRKPKQRVRTV